VVDTGIDEYVRRDGRLEEVTRSRENTDPLDLFPYVGGQPAPNGFLDFAAGHGTFAAGIVRQVDPDAQIRVYRALDSDGLASEVDVACAMIRAVQDGADVVNVSLGMRTADNRPCLAFELALDVIDELRESGEPAVIVASAGNYGTGDPVWPAASRRVLSVAGLTAGFQPAAWSTRGFWVDFSTVGEGIVSTYVEGTEDPAFGGNESYPPDAWALWAGTSFAAPQIAGAIARTCREDVVPPRVAARRLLRMGVPIPDFGRGLSFLPGT
jgi:subtilisin family serine protease